MEITLLIIFIVFYLIISIIVIVKLHGDNVTLKDMVELEETKRGVLIRSREKLIRDIVDREEKIEQLTIVNEGVMKLYFEEKERANSYSSIMLRLESNPTEEDLNKAVEEILDYHGAANTSEETRKYLKINTDLHLKIWKKVYGIE